MGIQLTESDVEEIVSVYLQTNNQIETAKITHHSITTVSKYIRQRGLGCGHGGNQTQRKVTDEEILSDVADGLTRGEIAKKRGVHVANLSRRMRRLNVSAVYAPTSKPVFADCWHFVESQKVAFEHKHPAFHYLETRNKNGSSRIRMRCKQCGSVIERAESTVRKRNIACDSCNEKQKNEIIRQKSQVELFKVIIAYTESKKKKICACCGGEYYSQYYLSAYCSESCKQKAKRKRAKQRYPSKHRASKSSKHISRAKKYGVRYEHGITLKKAIKKDNNICRICGKPCDANDNAWGVTGPLYPSIDHIVPLSKGGDHTWDNIQLAHIICNSYKGTSR